MSPQSRPPLSAQASVPQWGVLEASFHHRSDGDRFAVEVTALAEPVDAAPRPPIPLTGFYDGDDVFRVRFMPPTPGRWRLTLTSPLFASHEFDVTTAETEEHGPVSAAVVQHPHGTAHGFIHADGTPFTPIGTTCYAWTHQQPERRAQTLASLSHSPFTKLRMCVLPKSYAFTHEEPPRLPFAYDEDGHIDHDQPDPAFYRDLEDQIRALGERGVQADLILLHPYDQGRWGFDRMTPAQDARYLRYTIARLSAFAHVWWSLANEYDFLREKTLQDWQRILDVVADADPYDHLCSIHNGTRMYDESSLHLFDHADPRISHVSLQHWDLHQTPHWVARWNKPVVVDECGYEGDLPQRWGNLTGEEMVERVWTGHASGGFVGHGETFLNPGGPIWWSQGGTLARGESPERIAFMADVLELLGPHPALDPARYDVPTLAGDGGILQYFGRHRPIYREIVLPDEPHQIEIVDTWAMTRTPLPGRHAGRTRVDLPAREHLAILALPATA